MAREMADGGGWGTLTWQREPQFPRPPGAVSILAVARKLAPDERAVRWPLAMAAGAEVALLVLLGAALFGRATGALAGGVLLTFNLFIGYARYLESEPFLCAFVVAAFFSWEQARRRPRAQLSILAWGAFLGCALMTKQILGGLPLLSPCVDAWARDGETRPVTRRLLVRGLVAAALVWLPWHVYAIAHHGWPFVDSYLLANVLQRRKGAILHTTRFTYYGRELWRSEGWFGLIAIAAAAWALYDGIRKRERKPLTIGLWALGCFANVTISASRYDHYVLLAYPALALATAYLIVVKLPFTRPVRTVSALAYLAAAGAMHLPRDLAASTATRRSARWCASRRRRKRRSSRTTRTPTPRAITPAPTSRRCSRARRIFALPSNYGARACRPPSSWRAIWARPCAPSRGPSCCSCPARARRSCASCPCGSSANRDTIC